jgi:DNA-binding transcriptional MocR family regulator
MMSWKPDLTRFGGHPAEALADAIADAISTGALAAGARLPTHRELAIDLGLAVATVSKAYSIVGRRNLITGEVGRGTFVATGPRWPALTDPDGEAASIIDLRVCMAPAVSQDVALAAAVEDVMRAGGAKSFLRYPLPGGAPMHRAAAANWLARHWSGASVDETLVTSGGHQALSVALATVAAQGETVLCEPQTYAGLGQLAQVLGFKVRPVDADADGPLPDSIAEVAERNNASAILLMPTFQNPTAITISSRRRDQIAEVCARRKLWVIEDCVLSDILDSPPATICARIPDRTLLVGSLSKSVCVSLRFGFLRCPPELVARAEKNLQSLTLANSPLIMEVGALIIDDGRADQLRHRVGAEIEARYRLVRQVFDDLPINGFPRCPHVWVPVARTESLPELIAGLAQQGIWVATTRDFAVGHDGGQPGVRLALGATPHRHKISDACVAIRRLLMVPPQAAGVAM